MTAQTTPVAGATIYVPLDCNIDLEPSTADPSNAGNLNVGNATMWSQPNLSNPAALRSMNFRCNQPPGEDQNVTVQLRQNGSSVSGFGASVEGSGDVSGGDTGTCTPTNGDLLCWMISASAGYVGGPITIACGVHDGDS